VGCRVNRATVIEFFSGRNNSQHDLLSPFYGNPERLVLSL
jgi:hypothetical protein